jgi:membrane fusion protein, heavy metal efflux system
MKKSSYLLVFLLLSAVLLVSCHSKEKKEEKSELKTYKVTAQEVQFFVEATGSVQPDLGGASKIISHVPGTVAQILVKPGEKVKKGSGLLVIKSPDATDAYSAYLSSVAQLKQTERIYNLNKELFEVGAVTKNDLLNSESSFRQMEAVSAGLRKKLNLYGCGISGNNDVKRDSCSDTVTIRASIPGVVADIQAHIGDKVDAATGLMTIADPQNIIIVANIYDSDIPKIKKDSNVTFYVDIFDNTPFKGVVTYVSDISDTESKTVKTFIKILDRKDVFKQNMFLKLKIEREKRSFAVVPQSAIVYKDGNFYVYRSLPDGKSELKQVKAVRELPGKFMAVEGINEGDQIILSAIEMERP